MYSLVEARLKCNRNIKINFKGGEISSDSGLFLKSMANKKRLTLTFTIKAVDITLCFAMMD